MKFKKTINKPNGERYIDLETDDHQLKFTFPRQDGFRGDITICLDKRIIPDLQKALKEVSGDFTIEAWFHMPIKVTPLAERIERLEQDIFAAVDRLRELKVKQKHENN